MAKTIIIAKWIIAALMGMILLVPPAHAHGAFAVGIGPYLSQMDYSGFEEPVEHSGAALTAAYGFGNHVGLRGALFYATHDEVDDWVAYGGDANLVAGWNLRRSGLRLFAGVGYYVDYWDSDDFEHRFEGTQFVVGGGWAGSRLVLELTVAARDSGEHAQWLYDEGYLGGEVTALAGGVTLAYRF